MSLSPINTIRWRCYRHYSTQIWARLRIAKRPRRRTREFELLSFLLLNPRRFVAQQLFEKGAAKRLPLTDSFAIWIEIQDYQKPA